MLIPFTDLKEKYKLSVRGIIHIGASTGQEMPEYAKNGVENVVWVEANPEVYGQLVGNMMNYSKTRCINALITDKTGDKRDFNLADNNGESSSIFEFGTHEQDHPNVKMVGKIPMMETIRFDDLATMHKLDLRQYNFLNMDIQGAELLALKGMVYALEFFDYIYVEVNNREVYKGNGLVGEIDDLLAEAGFEGVEDKMTDAGWGDKLYVRTNAAVIPPAVNVPEVTKEAEKKTEPVVQVVVSGVGPALTEMEAVIKTLHNKISQETSGSTADNLTNWLRNESSKVIKKYVK